MPFQLIKVAAAVACMIPVLGISAHEAKAAPVTITVNSVTGAWSNIVGGTNVVVSPAIPAAHTTVTWGTGGTSGYAFDGVAPPPTPAFSPGDVFDLGTFTHNNQPINSGTAITAATLTLAINATISGFANPVNLSSVFNISHNETPNGDNPCANGGANGVGVNVNGCADIVTMLTNPGGSTSVNIDGIDYIFAFSGFLVTGGTPLSQFFTIENSNNTATLQGSFVDKTTVNPVPLPAALPLFAGGLGLLGFLSRRRRKPMAEAA